ncbi:MAG: pantoate--beta-alanine ligase [Candidatus Omnitrophica bacterium]|nr:pantoate--beta-alanine ligase [Candidatus Omnitrophota bacterium]
MKIVKDPRKVNSIIKEVKLKGKSIGFVPTMGALHEGHLSLIRQAHKENDFTVVSIFVNPMQFGPKEDLKKYPRLIQNDLMLCKKDNVDLVFLPDSKNLYPPEFGTFVKVKGLSDCLCAKSRPMHFQGVTTVITKLFNIVCPDVAYFGQKDAQQAIIIKRLSEDLNFPVKISMLETVRAKDGLALSSRNAYLSKSQRQDALVLSQALKLAKKMIDRGETVSKKIISSMRRLIQQNKSAKIDYVEIVDFNNLRPVKKISGKCLIVLAVWIGKIRLIDNIIVGTVLKHG